MTPREGWTIESPTRYEHLLLAALDALGSCPKIDVSHQELVVESQAEGPNGISAARLAAEAMEAASLLPELEQVIVAPAIAEQAPRFRRIAAHWRGREAVQDLTGEFRIPQFYRAIFEPAPPLAWEGSPPDELELLAQFRQVDGHPRSGTGQFALVRLEPNTTPLEIWVWDARLGAQRMDLDYLGYLEALAVTKGTYGWQYLFTDLSFLNDDLYHVAESMKAMLRRFPDLFPQHDYTQLRERLEERL
ncbi:hypothetical protein AB0A94_15765 [Streptomyces sp. NPDC044984]|uniref:hypothetical protein n=1 Tax=Streptomyces sp. NPDC044984 TaxID=3154335 RepID=UPI0033F89BA4